MEKMKCLVLFVYLFIYISSGLIIVWSKDFHLCIRNNVKGKLTPATDNVVRFKLQILQYVRCRNGV